MNEDYMKVNIFILSDLYFPSVCTVLNTVFILLEFLSNITAIVIIRKSFKSKQTLNCQQEAENPASAHEEVSQRQLERWHSSGNN